jgi:hypothetical protein
MGYTLERSFDPRVWTGPGSPPGFDRNGEDGGPLFFVSVAAKGLKAIVGSNQWTVVSEEKNSGSELERGEQPFGAQGKRAGMGCGSFRQGPDGVGTSRNLRSGLRVNKHERE